MSVDRPPIEDWDWFNRRRLGAGEYVLPGSSSTATQSAQSTFMRAICYWAPEILTEAAEAMLDIYVLLQKNAEELFGPGGCNLLDVRHIDPYTRHDRAMSAEFRNLYMQKECLTTFEPEGELDRFTKPWPKLTPHLEDFRRALGNWMGKYELPYLWILDDLRHSLDVLAKQADSDADQPAISAFKSRFGTPGFIQAPPLSAEERELTIVIPEAYDPLFQDEKIMKEHCRNVAVAQINAYFELMDRRMTDLGYVRSVQKRSPVHYLMLVDRHVRRHTWGKIGETFGMDEHSARDAVEDLAEVMCLELPQFKRGRPTKKKQVQQT